jgi:signal transduction histidine kinase
VQGFTRELAQACEVLQAVLPTALPSLDNAQRTAVTTALEGDIPEALGFIRAGVVRMDDLLEAVLKLSRMGHRPLLFEAVDMEALVQQCVRTLAHQLRERQVGVTVDALPQVHADSIAMSQIVSNLLSNAIDALMPGRPGELRITAAAGPETMAFHIQDNGRGIAAEDIPTVFEMFRRLDPQEAAGAGMGLTYVRALPAGMVVTSGVNPRRELAPPLRLLLQTILPKATPSSMRLARLCPRRPGRSETSKFLLTLP